MTTVLLIVGKETHGFTGGNYTKGLIEAAVETFNNEYEVLTTVIKDGYKVSDEIAKHKKADAVINQYPVYWFMMPPRLKRYIDQAFAYGGFFDFGDGPDGTGGLMPGKKVMPSTTWNAPPDLFNAPSGFLEGLSRDELLLRMRESRQFCGFEELPHFSCHKVTKEPRFGEDRQRLVAHLKDTFQQSVGTSVSASARSPSPA